MTRGSYKIVSKICMYIFIKLSLIVSSCIMLISDIIHVISDVILSLLVSCTECAVELFAIGGVVLPWDHTHYITNVTTHMDCHDNKLFFSNVSPTFYVKVMNQERREMDTLVHYTPSAAVHTENIGCTCVCLCKCVCKDTLTLTI